MSLRGYYRYPFGRRALRVLEQDQGHSLRELRQLLADRQLLPQKFRPPAASTIGRARARLEAEGRGARHG